MKLEWKRRTMIQAGMIVGALVFAAITVLGQVQPNSVVWIDPTNQYANYLEAAVLKKHTPVTFTTDKTAAVYIATLASEAKKGSTARAIFLGAGNSGAKSNLSLTLADAKTGAVVFSYTCQKNGEFGSFQSASECLAKHWNNFIAKGKP